MAQRVGMEYIGPFLFNAIRFALGGLVLLPFIIWPAARRRTRLSARSFPFRKEHLFAGILAGSTLFMGASFQQVGIVYTTAGKAGFITGLYVILVPILGLLWRKHTYPEAWVGAVLAVAGLYLLSMTSSLTMSAGDLLVLISAVFWALHVHIIDKYTSRMGSLLLAHIQFITCSLFSFVVAFAFENIVMASVSGAWAPILYAGLLSTGVAYTLQVVAQKEAHPSHAAIILSLESVFAAVGGWLILSENLTLREMLGCALMLAGMLLSQIHFLGFLPRKRGETNG